MSFTSGFFSCILGFTNVTSPVIMKELLKIIEQTVYRKPTPWAKAHKISPVTISRLLNGEVVSAANYLKIARAAKIPVDELIENSLQGE